MPQFNPKELSIDKAAPWPRLRPAFPAWVAGAGFRFPVGLRLPENTRSEQGRFDDTDIVHVVSEGFVLVPPTAERLRFTPGSTIPSLQLQPWFGPSAPVSGVPVWAWQLGSVGVLAARTTTSDWEIWNQPLRIIGVLISL